MKAVEAGKQPAGTGTSYYTVKAGEDVFARDADWHLALAPDIIRDKILQTVKGRFGIAIRARTTRAPTIN